MIRGNTSEAEAEEAAEEGNNLSHEDSAPDGQLAKLAQELLDGVGGAASSGIVESGTTQSPAPRQIAPTMGRIAKTNYSHDGMIDLIIANPGITQNQIAATLGYTPGWVSNVFASDAFQARLAERRKEVIDPVLVATVEERAKALYIRAQEVLMAKLDQPAVSDTAALRAFELGAKAMGLGGNAPPKPVVVDLSALANRLIALKRGPQALEGEMRVVNE